MPQTGTPASAPLISAETPPLRVDEHGVIRVIGTRVTLETIIAAFLDGASAEVIADQYPSVTLANVYAAISYFLTHRDTLEPYISRRRVLAQKVREKIEQRWPSHELRARLLARRDVRNSEAKA